MATRSTKPRLICLTGPESSGKTALAQQLAERFGAPLVLEQARTWLTARGGRYTEQSLVEIAQQQRLAELAAGEGVATAPCLLLDTDIQVIEVWWWHKFASPLWQRRFSHRAPPRRLYPLWLQQQLTARTQRHYLLTAPDLPWQFDPLRESPGERAILFDQYRRLLRRDGLSFHVVRGSGDARLQAALRGLHRRLV